MSSNDLEVGIKELTEKVSNELNLSENVKRIAESLLTGHRSEGDQRKDNHMVKAAVILSMVAEQQKIEVSASAVETISLVVSC